MKQKKALLIDNNQTVQALCQLALEQVGVAMEILTDGSGSLAAAQKLEPDLVICNRDVKGIDPFIVCEQLKLAAPNLKFILLASGQSASAISREAQGSGVDEVLLKPFKSEQLKQAAARLLGSVGNQPQSPSANPPLYLLVDDPFYKKVIELFFQSRRVEIRPIELQSLVSEKISFVNQSALLDISTAIQIPEHVSRLRECTIIADVDSVPSLRAQFPVAAILPRPLTCETLLARFGKIYPENPKEKSQVPLSTAEQAVLCAKISASVFERLISSRALRERNWSEAGESAVQELMRICKKFEAATRS